MRALASANANAPRAAVALEAPSIAPTETANIAAGETAQRYEHAVRDFPVIDRAIYDELAGEVGEESICEMLDVFVEETVGQMRYCAGRVARSIGGSRARGARTKGSLRSLRA